MTVTPDDLRAAAELCRRKLQAHGGADWTVPAGDLDTTCRDTLDHIVSTQVFYANQLANRAPARLPRLRTRDPDAPLEHMLELVPAGAAVLAAVAAAAGTEARAFHPAGMADAEGFLAMGCDEILVHTGDIATGVGVEFEPPPDLCARVLRRLFPWAPTDTEPWPTLLWSNGRGPLGDRERLDAYWYWHCPPLAEWDGTVTRRIKPSVWT